MLYIDRALYRTFSRPGYDSSSVYSKHLWLRQSRFKFYIYLDRNVEDRISKLYQMRKIYGTHNKMEILYKQLIQKLSTIYVMIEMIEK